MTDAAVGKRVKAMAEARGVSVPQLAEGLGIDQSVLYRLLRGKMKWTVDYLTKAATVLATTPAAILAPAAAEPATGTNETAPSLVEGAETASQLVSEAERSVAYWIGKQQGLLQVLEYVQSLQKNASDMQGKAIEVQREIIGRTIPTPADDAADRERRIRDALDAEAERQARERDQRRTQRRASGGAPPPPPRGGGARRRKPRPDSSA